MPQRPPEEKAKPTSTGLIIGTPQKKLLSKQQQSFNKLIRKIEKLRSDLVQLSKSLDQKLDFYGSHIYPLKQQQTELNKETVKLLFQFYKNKKFLSKKERDTLGRIITDRLDDIFQFEGGEPADELKAIFKAVQGISYEESVKEDFEMMKGEMESMFEAFGFEMDLDDLHHKMKPEELMQKAMEMEEDILQQANEKESKQADRKKTKKQVEREEKAKQAEEVRTKNISSIYKQLAKIFHPDLEQNEELKLQKEELMKQLTNAYENNDLHTLLNLELVWIQNEENNPGKLTDDKLAIYNQALKQQILELEDEINAVLTHPRYEPLHEFATLPGLLTYLNMKDIKKHIESLGIVIIANLATLKGNEKQAIATVKKFIRDFDIEEESDIHFPDDDNFYWRDGY